MTHHAKPRMTADEALRRLKEGNRAYAATGANAGDVSRERREATARDGQSPCAVVISCSDSRSTPETVFSAGIGEIFVIRVAGNIIDATQLGSIEYAVEHLGVRLVVVLGHTHCGAVESAIHHEPEGYVKNLTDKVLEAIGDETDELKATRLNALHGVAVIEESLEIRDLEKHAGLRVAAAVHDIASGAVEFL